MGIPAGPDTPEIETDPATPVGMVRMLITDLDADNVLFTDVQIGQFLTVQSGNARLAAASLLEIIAVSETLLSKKFSTQDLSVDGPAVAASLMKQADRLREQENSGYGLDAPVWSFPAADPRWDYARYW